MIEWKPIGSAPIEPFRPEDWFLPHSRRLLLWIDGFAKLGSYFYTKTGQGRWVADDGHIYTPTHWASFNAPEGT